METNQNLDRSRMNIKDAETVLDDAAQLVRITRVLFELELGDEVIRYRPELPGEFKEADSMILFGRNRITTTSIDDSPVSANRTRRLWLMAELIRAYVRAKMADVYVEYWRESKGLKHFGVLAHQATAFALAVHFDNWDYFAPLVFVAEDEPITDENKQHLCWLVDHGQAALAYALCLNAQMNVLPGRMHKKYAQVRGPKPVENQLEPAKWPELTSWARGTQNEIATAHISAVGDDKREQSWYFNRKHPGVHPKMRLTGFARTRGGGSKRKAGQR